MMKHEFEKLIGETISQEDYNEIENCYMYLDTLFSDKQSVAEAYKQNGLPFFKRLSAEVHAKQSVVSEYKKAVEITKKQVEDLKHSSIALGVCIETLTDLNESFESDKLANLIKILVSSQNEVNVAAQELKSLYSD